ncbi:unnamed protein product [Gadus morhua 'NCC']
MTPPAPRQRCRIALRNTDASAAASSRRGAEKDSENTADLYYANVNVYKTPPHTQDTGDGLQQHTHPSPS